MTATILIIEDDANLASGLQYNLEQAGYRVLAARDGRAGLESALNERPDLILLDLMLPEMPGMEVLRRLREEGRDVPVLILSAIDEEVEKVRGFDLGAVDYVTKPFGVAELLARIRVRIKSTQAEDEDLLTFPHGVVRMKQFTFEGKDESVGLTPTEVEILQALRARAPRAVSRHDLIRGIWGLSGASTRTLDTHVARLRKKIEPDPAQPRHLVTVHGVGYRLVL